MDDFNVVIKQSDGTEVVANTDMIEEDILRLRIGLDIKEHD